MFQTYYGPRVPEIDGILDDLTSERFGLVKRIMSEAIDDGELRPADPDFLALCFCCLIDQPINLFSRQSKPSSYLTPKMADALISIFLGGCR